MVLENDTHMLTTILGKCICRQRSDICSTHSYSTAIRSVKTCADVKKCTLTRARSSDYCHKLTVKGRKRYSVDRRYCCVILFILLDYIINL